MKRTTAAALMLLVVPVGIMLGCGRSADQTQVAKSPVKQQAPHASTAATSKSKIDWCIVSGEKLGAMGDPVHYKYQDRDVTFCCKNCIKEFEANPLAYLARLDSAEAGLIGPPAKSKG